MFEKDFIGTKYVTETLVLCEHNFSRTDLIQNSVDVIVVDWLFIHTKAKYLF